MNGNSTRILSREKPFPQKDYGDLPKEWWTETGGLRKIATEEACRDLDKSAEQLLVDIHDESLNRDTERRPQEHVARTLARLGSMQLRTEREVSKLNKTVLILTISILILTAIGAAAACGQFYYAKKSYEQQTVKTTP